MRDRFGRVPGYFQSRLAALTWNASAPMGEIH